MGGLFGRYLATRWCCVLSFATGRCGNIPVFLPSLVGLRRRVSTMHFLVPKRSVRTCLFCGCQALSAKTSFFRAFPCIANGWK